MRPAESKRRVKRAAALNEKVVPRFDRSDCVRRLAGKPVAVLPRQAFLGMGQYPLVDPLKSRWPIAMSRL